MKLFTSKGLRNAFEVKIMEHKRISWKFTDIFVNYGEFEIPSEFLDFE